MGTIKSNCNTISRVAHVPTVFTTGKRVRLSATTSVFSISPSCKAGQIRIATVTSKKAVHKRAVKRNRARRRVKAALAQIIAQLPELGVGWNWVVVCRREVIDMPWDNLLHELSMAWERGPAHAKIAP